MQSPDDLEQSEKTTSNNSKSPTCFSKKTKRKRVAGLTKVNSIYKLFHFLHFIVVFLPVSLVILFDLVYHLQCAVKRGEIDSEDLIGCRIKIWWPTDKK